MDNNAVAPIENGYFSERCTYTINRTINNRPSNIKNN